VADSVWLPVAGFVNVNVLFPFVSGWLIGVPPSTVSETVPVGVPPVEPTLTTTEPFVGQVTAAALIEVVVVAGGAGFTVIDPVTVLAPKLPCAAYDAVRVWSPTLGLVSVNVLAPFVSGCVVAVAPSTLSETLPVGVPLADDTVTVTTPLAGDVTVGAVMVVVVAVITGAFTVNVPVAVLAAKLPCAA
jgi:hypothetical protein